MHRFGGPFVASLILAASLAMPAAYAADGVPVYMSSEVPAGFGPGLPRPMWQPTWSFSADAPWTLTLRQGSSAGTVVRTLTGTSELGEIAPTWDGTGDAAVAAPHGSYHWTLSGSMATRTGTVFLSRVTPPKPSLTAPVLVSDVSTTLRYPVSWSGAPPAAHYVVERSYFGTSFVPVASTTKRGFVATGESHGTQRWRVRVVDPAGRTGPWSAVRTTVTPFDDTLATTFKPHLWVRSYDGRHWRGSQQRTSGLYDSMNLNVRGDGIWLVGPKGPAYGRFRVTVDYERTYLVDQYAPENRFRQVLFKLGGLTDEWHEVTIDPVATPGRQRVGIDGAAGRKAMHSG